MSDVACHVVEGRHMREITGYDTWEQLVRDQSPRLFRVAYRITGNREDAADVLQEAFVRMYTHLDSYAPGTFDGWAYRITERLSLTAYRLRKFTTVPTDPTTMVEFQAGGPSVPELVELRALDGGAIPTVAQLRASRALPPPVIEALAALTDKRRHAVLCRSLLGMTIAQTAEALGCSEYVVRKRTHDGLEHLLKALKSESTVESAASQHPAAKRSRRSSSGPRAVGASRQRPASADALSAARRARTSAAHQRQAAAGTPSTS